MEKKKKRAAGYYTHFSTNKLKETKKELQDEPKAAATITQRTVIDKQ